MEKSRLSFAGIKRNVEYSPNHRLNDDEIFTLTSKELINLGCTVNMYSEDEFMNMTTLLEEHVFTMARSKATVRKLQQLQHKGTLVINSAFGINQCYRINMTNGLIKHDVPFPKSFIVSTSNPDASLFGEYSNQKFWIKRGDFHAIHKEDVSFVNGADHGISILKEYRLRNIREAVVSEHLFGDLVKFYGVRGTGFFHWFYPFENNHSKFNTEAVNGAAVYHAFDAAMLHKHGDDAAAALSVDIYGGDAIISSNGDISIIDLNDWPSFAPCREEAAGHIAGSIYKQAIRHAAKKAKSLI